jgi:hypothetical protein
MRRPGLVRGRTEGNARALEQQPRRLAIARVGAVGGERFGQWAPTRQTQFAPEHGLRAMQCAGLRVAAAKPLEQVQRIGAAAIGAGHRGVRHCHRHTVAEARLQAIGDRVGFVDEVAADRKQRGLRGVDPGKRIGTVIISTPFP